MVRRSVKEKEWLEALNVLGMNTEDGKAILNRLGCTIRFKHENVFGSYWRQLFGPPSSIAHLLGKASLFEPPGLPMGAKR